MEFLVHGARDFNEPGIFMSFEERDKDQIENFSDLSSLVASERLPLIMFKSREAKSWKRTNSTSKVYPEPRVWPSREFCERKSGSFFGGLLPRQLS